MNTTTLEPASAEAEILRLMREELAKARVQETELWPKVEEAERLMRPVEEAYKDALHRWMTVREMRQSLERCIAAKESEL